MMICVAEDERGCECAARWLPSTSKPLPSPSRLRVRQRRGVALDFDVQVAIIIPARLESERLPGKLLLAKTGKPLIQHTWEAATQSRLADVVAVATDSQEIVEACRKFGAHVILSQSPHANGTSRVAEAAEQFPNAKILVNLQADEPEISGDDIDALIRRVQQPDCSCTAYGIATLAAPLHDMHRNNPSAVKVVVSHGWAMWFSRTAMAGSLHHVGAYAFRRQTLDLLRERVLGDDTAERALADAEKLEQLAWLENHYHVAVERVKSTRGGVNTKLDYDEFVWRWEQRNG